MSQVLRGGYWGSHALGERIIRPKPGPSPGLKNRLRQPQGTAMVPPQSATKTDKIPSRESDSIVFPDRTYVREVQNCIFSIQDLKNSWRS